MSFDEMGEALFQGGAPQGEKRQPVKLDDAPMILIFNRPAKVP